MAVIYERIGHGYAGTRRRDPRIAAHLDAAVGAAHTVLEVGSGTGSYEPSGPVVLAVEPSAVMIAQRSPAAAPVMRAVAESLPVADGAVDVATAVLTHHHWSDAARGFAELRRVSRRQVVLTWDPHVTARFWLVRDYLPEIAEREFGLATVDAAVAGLGAADVHPVLVPHDCTDGFLGAYWRRPEVYLDPAVRAGMSDIALLDQRVVDAAMQRLDADLRAGMWARTNAELLDTEAFDIGYRLVVAGG